MGDPSFKQVLLSVGASLLLGGAFWAFKVLLVVFFGYAEGFFRIPLEVVRMERFRFLRVKEISRVGRQAPTRFAGIARDFIFFFSCGIAFLLFQYLFFDGAFRLYPLLLILFAFRALDSLVSPGAEKLLSSFFPLLAIPLSVLFALFLRPVRFLCLWFRRRFVYPAFRRLRRVFLRLYHEKRVLSELNREKDLISACERYVSRKGK